MLGPARAARGRLVAPLAGSSRSKAIPSASGSSARRSACPSEAAHHVALAARSRPRSRPSPASSSPGTCTSPCPSCAPRSRRALRPALRVFDAKYWFDDVYDAFVRRVVVGGSDALLWKRVDAGLIDGAVNGAGTRHRGARRDAAAGRDRLRPALRAPRPRGGGRHRLLPPLVMSPVNTPPPEPARPPAGGGGRPRGPHAARVGVAAEGPRPRSSPAPPSPCRSCSSRGFRGRGRAAVRRAARPGSRPGASATTSASTGCRCGS